MEFVLEKPVIMLAAALLLSIIVERFIEILKSLFDYYSAYYFQRKAKQYASKASESDGESKELDYVKDNYWTRLAVKIGKKLELRLDNAKSDSVEGSELEAEDRFNVIMSVASRYLSPATERQDGLFAISASKVRGVYLKLVSKVLAIVIGLILALAFSMDLIAMVKLSLHEVKIYNPGFWGEVLTGLAIGMGSGPTHKIIETMEKMRKKRDAKAE